MWSALHRLMTVPAGSADHLTASTPALLPRCAQCGDPLLHDLPPAHIAPAALCGDCALDGVPHTD